MKIVSISIFELNSLATRRRKSIECIYRTVGDCIKINCMNFKFRESRLLPFIRSPYPKTEFHIVPDLQSMTSIFFFFFQFLYAIKLRSIQFNQMERRRRQILSMTLFESNFKRLITLSKTFPVWLIMFLQQ